MIIRPHLTPQARGGNTRARPTSHRKNRFDLQAADDRGCDITSVPLTNLPIRIQQVAP